MAQTRKYYELHALGCSYGVKGGCTLVTRHHEETWWKDILMLSPHMETCDQTILILQYALHTAACLVLNNVLQRANPHAVARWMSCKCLMALWPRPYSLSQDPTPRFGSWQRAAAKDVSSPRHYNSSPGHSGLCNQQNNQQSMRSMNYKNLPGYLFLKIILVAKKKHSR